MKILSLIKLRYKQINWYNSNMYTAIQVGRSRFRFPMVSSEFFIDIIFPAALWLFDLPQPVTEMSSRNISWGINAAGA